MAHRQFITEFYENTLWFFQKDTYCLDITHTLQTLNYVCVYVCIYMHVHMYDISNDKTDILL